MQIGEKGREIAKLCIFVVFFAILAGLVPITALYIGRGAENFDLFQAAIFYFAVAPLALGGVIALHIIQHFVAPRNPNSLLGMFKSFIHDPDEGMLGKIAGHLSILRPLRNPLILAFFSFFIFGGVTVYAVANQSFFVATPTYTLSEQQITETGKLILHTEPAATVESVLFLFIHGLLYGILSWFGRHIKGSKLVILLVIIPLLIGTMWMAYHGIRYENSEQDLFRTFAFGAIGSFTVSFTGSIIPWLIWHELNNALGKASELFSQEPVLLVFASIYILFVFAGFAFLILSKKGRRNELETLGEA